MTKNELAEAGRKTGWIVSRIEAEGYKCLGSVAVDLGPLEVLVGPNGSGKSALLDTVAFMSDIQQAGLVGAIEGSVRTGSERRTEDPRDLAWMRREGTIRLAIELTARSEDGQPTERRNQETIRYVIEVDPREPLTIHYEEVLRCLPENKLKSLLKRTREGRIRIRDTKGRIREETAQGKYSALEGLNRWDWADEDLGKLRHFLSEDIRRTGPDSDLKWLKEKTRAFARTAHRMAETYPESFDWWQRHVREAVPNLGKLVPEEDGKRLVVREADGWKTPFEALSRGTRRILELTILAYAAPNEPRINLIECPENGVHPKNLEIVFQSLECLYTGQALVETSSPTMAMLAKRERLLCFTSGENGTEIVRGDKHRILGKDDVGHLDPGMMMASGVLG